MDTRVHEIFAEFNRCNTKEERIAVLHKYDSPQFRTFLEYTFNPGIEFYYNQFPRDYIEPDTVPGISYSTLLTEMRRAYLFIKGHPNSSNITEEKRNILLLQVLETMEPKEATYFINMMKKNLGVKHLTINLIKEAYNIQ